MRAYLHVMVFLISFVAGQQANGQVKQSELDAPEGKRTFTGFNGGGTYQYTGKVKHLVINAKNPGDPAVDGAVTIDASKLEAETVEINGRIDGRSAVLLNATTEVIINGRVDGRSILVINCGGTVTVKNGRIDGKSRVRIKARDIRLEERIDGAPFTQVYFNAKRDFEIKDRVDGKAVLEEVKINNAFELKGPPFADDGDEDGERTIPARARRLSELLSKK
jgi:hypothetical protein